MNGIDMNGGFSFSDHVGKGYYRRTYSLSTQEMTAEELKEYLEQHRETEPVKKID